MTNTEMTKVSFGAGLAGAGLKSLAAYGTKKSPGVLGKIVGGLGSASIPALGYMMGKHHTTEDIYSQARGTVRAGAANYWNQMSPMQRYGAAMFPTAARMRAESQLGPDYRKFYEQYYGAPGQQQGGPQAAQGQQR